MSNFQLPAGFRPAQQPGGAGPSSGGQGGQQQSDEQRQAAEERQQQQQDMKRGMIAAMLEPAARERYAWTDIRYDSLNGTNRIPDKHQHAQTPKSYTPLYHHAVAWILASSVEDLLVRMGQQGQIRGQVSDDALKGLLEQVSNPPQTKPAAAAQPQSARTKSLGGGITIQRKGHDSDSDEYDL